MASRVLGQDLRVGLELGHCRIVEKIGAGGMGEVYRARDEHLARDVAIKVLPPGTLIDESARKHFRKEALILSQLNHPNIATIHDFDTQQGVDFLVMEYIPGITLSEKVSAAPLPEKEVLRLGVQLAEGLAAAHEQGIIHRDLKPGNLRVTSDGRLKILDFGLAKLRLPVTASATTESLSETHAMAGTLPYMAPEQLLGEEIDARTDIHAAGEALYEMATGQQPFAQVERSQLVGAILQRPPRPPTAVNPRLSPELERIIGKCLEKEPGSRYQSAKELAIDLRRLQTGMVSAAQPAAKLAKWSSARWVGLGLGIPASVIVLLIAFNVGDWRERLLGRTGAPRIDSLAVLPLANLSGDPQQEYFADAMTEELIATLGQIEALRVTSRTSVMRFKDVRPVGGLPEIARQLKVDAVVEGSVLHSGDRVRITAQLIDARTDRHVWARSYERDLRDVLGLQTDVAQAIANEIKIKLTPQEQARLARSHPISPEAHEAYLKGRYHWNLRTEQGLKKGIEYFQQAIDKDPDYAPAYAGLADSYVGLAEWGLMASREAYPRAKAAASRALGIDETLAEAHASLGAARNDYDWDWVGAEKEFKRAIELNPGYATAHQWYAEYLSEKGRHDEAVAELRRAQELDPLSPIIGAVGGYIFLFAGRYDEAEAQCRRALELNAGFYPAHFNLGRVYLQEKLYAQAISEYEKAIAPEEGNPELATELVRGYAAAGKRTEALKTLSQLKELSKRRYISPYRIAQAYAALGDFDQAFALLEKAYEERTGDLIQLKVEPENDPLRSDPRFQDLLRRMNLLP